MLLSTGSLKFRQLEIDGANGEMPRCHMGKYLQNALEVAEFCTAFSQRVQAMSVSILRRSR